MTNIQLEYSKHLENVRHDKAVEETNAKDVAEKVRHNVEQEGLTSAQQELDRYLGELNNQLQHRKLATESQLKELEILTDAALRDYQNKTQRRQAAATIDKYQAEAVKALLDAQSNRTAANARATAAEANMQQAKTAAKKSKSEISLNKAKALETQAKTFNGIRSVLSALGAKTFTTIEDEPRTAKAIFSPRASVGYLAYQQIKNKWPSSGSGSHR